MRRRIRKLILIYFFFDSLSSGAGYCPALVEQAEKLLKSWKIVHLDVTVHAHDCLMHC